jgi:SlyX protein
MDTRLTELEVKLAFAEDLLETLNATVCRQQQDIETLQRQVRQLREQLLAQPSAEPHSLRDEIPPHY